MPPLDHEDMSFEPCAWDCDHVLRTRTMGLGMGPRGLSQRGSPERRILSLGAMGGGPGQEMEFVRRLRNRWRRGQAQALGAPNGP